MVNEKKKTEYRAKSRRAGAKKKHGKVWNCGKQQWKEVWNKMNIQELIV